ncbi:AbrB/MazE/SpoVT family DNA-binding domain-containing protein [Candidatus Woesearchaeota archaeon]|nr:AbrB/MazE/SpoVT family DNA-binding domain-containing protein [Candidatus Woesearchaeota archaeon]
MGVKMRRKVIQIANSTQLVSLPRTWAKEHNIKKGDELELNIQKNKIIISTEKESEQETIDVNVTNLDRSSLMFLIRALYKKGYDEINLRFDNQLAKHYRINENVKVISSIHQEVNRLTGIEIVQQKENFCKLKTISKTDDKELDNMIRRTFILLLDAAKDVIDAAKNGNSVLLETIEEKHDTLTKFISYCIRTINKRKTEDKNTHFLYHIIATMDKIVDILKNCSRELEGFNKKVKKESLEVLNKTYSSFEKFYELFYKYNAETVKILSENKEQVMNSLISLSGKVPVQELLLLSNMNQTLELFRDLTESRIAMEF